MHRLWAIHQESILKIDTFKEQSLLHLPDQSRKAISKEETRTEEVLKFLKKFLEEEASLVL